MAAVAFEAYVIPPATPEIELEAEMVRRYWLRSAQPAGGGGREDWTWARGRRGAATGDSRPLARGRQGPTSRCWPPLQKRKSPLKTRSSGMGGRRARRRR